MNFFYEFCDKRYVKKTFNEDFETFISDLQYIIMYVSEDYYHPSKETYHLTY